MKNKGSVPGLVCGILLAGLTTTTLATSGILAELSTQPIYVDRQQAQMTAYAIGGNNYVKLRNVGEAVGFNVYWQSGVQIDSDAPYTGAAPEGKSGQTENASVTEELATVKDEIILRTNDLRIKNGLAELHRDQLLMKAAQIRTEEMAATGSYSHTRPNGSNFTTVTDRPYVAENINRIAMLYLEQQRKHLAEATVDSWAHSGGHLENMLESKAEGIGVGIAQGVNTNGKPAWYCVQLFRYGGYSVTWVDTPQT